MLLNKLKEMNISFSGKCETINHGYNKPAIIADAFESLIGAIYIDGGFEKAREVALKLLSKTIESSIKGDTEIIDYKSLLQEKLQEKGNVNIQYNLVKETGPDHKKVFHTEIVINDIVEGFGIGKTRKISEQKAAEVAYAKYI
jgi:ribonuclease III